MKPGVRTTEHWRVGRVHRVLGTTLVGGCISVTPWGNDQIRWVRLRFADGRERSFAPSHLQLLKNPAARYAELIS
jgi:hypothetical protein